MLPCWTFDLLLEAATGSMRVERHASSAKSECTDVMGEESGICRCLGDVSHCLGTTCFPLQNLSVERTDLLNETRKSHLTSITKIVLGCHGGPIVLVLIKAAEDQNHLLKLKG